MLKQKDFDLGKSKIVDLFLTIWVPTLIAVLITGTFVVFDGIFITHGFHAGSIFEENSFMEWAGDSTTIEGEYAGYGAVALGYAVPYTLLLVSAGIMVGGAMSYNISKARAAEDKVREQQIMDAFLPICIIVGIVLMIVLIPFAKFWIWMGSGFQPIFIKNWLNNPLFNSDWTPDILLNPIPSNTTDFGPGLAGHIFQQSSWYLRIQALAAIPYIYMVAVPYILREEGKPKISIYVNIIALGGNILWDFILIIVLGMNLVGAAIATIMAESMGALAFMYYLKNKATTKIKSTNWKIAKDDIGGIVKNGSSYMGMQLLQMAIILSMTMSIGFVFYNDPITISQYNSSFQNYFSFYTLINLIALGTIVSITPIINYSYNIKNKERLNESKLLGRRVLITLCTLATILVLFFPVIISTMFNSPDPFLAQRISQIMILGFTMGNIIIYAGLYFQGLGQVKKANMLIFTKPLLVFILAIVMGLTFKQFEGVHLVWINSLLPWNESPDNWEAIGVPVVCLAIFWVIPIVDFILGTAGSIMMNRSIRQIELEFAHDDYVEQELEEELEEIVEDVYVPIEKLNRKEIRKANKIKKKQAEKNIKKIKRE